MFRPVLRASSGMSIQKPYKGRYNINLRGLFYSHYFCNVKYKIYIIKYKTYILVILKTYMYRYLLDLSPRIWWQYKRNMKCSTKIYSRKRWPPVSTQSKLKGPWNVFDVFSNFYLINTENMSLHKWRKKKLLHLKNNFLEISMILKLF